MLHVRFSSSLPAPLIFPVLDSLIPDSLITGLALLSITSRLQTASWMHVLYRSPPLSVEPGFQGGGMVCSLARLVESLSFSAISLSSNFMHRGLSTLMLQIRSIIIPL